MTWRFGLPSSSSHALIGGLVGAAVTQGDGRDPMGATGRHPAQQLRLL